MTQKVLIPQPSITTLLNESAERFTLKPQKKPPPLPDCWTSLDDASSCPNNTSVYADDDRYLPAQDRKNNEPGEEEHFSELWIKSRPVKVIEEKQEQKTEKKMALKGFFSVFMKVEPSKGPVLNVSTETGASFDSQQSGEAISTNTTQTPSAQELDAGFIKLYTTSAKELERSLYDVLSCNVASQAFENISTLGVVMATAKLRKARRSDLFSSIKRESTESTSQSRSSIVLVRQVPSKKVQERMVTRSAFEQEYAELWGRPVLDSVSTEFHLTMQEQTKVKGIPWLFPRKALDIRSTKINPDDIVINPPEPPKKKEVKEEESDWRELRRTRDSVSRWLERSYTNTK